jgi:hypothetical protein
MILLPQTSECWDYNVLPHPYGKFYFEKQSQQFIFLEYAKIVPGVRYGGALL